MKKILSMMLALCMIATMLTVTVNAAGDDNVPNKQLWTLYDADASTKSFPLTKSNKNVYFFESTDLTDMVYQGQAAVGFAGGSVKNSVVDKVADPVTGDNTNKVFKLNTDFIQSTYRAWFNGGYEHPIIGQDGTYAWNKDRMDGNNVIHFSVRLMIPSEQPESVVYDDPTKISRTVYFDLQDMLWGKGISGCTTNVAKGESMANYGATFEITYKDNEEGVDDQLLITTSVNTEYAQVVAGTEVTPVTVDFDKWFVLDYEAYIYEGEKIQLRSYVNKQPVAYYESKTNYNRTIDEEASSIRALHSSSNTITGSVDEILETTYFDEWEVYTSSKTAPAIPNTLKITGDATKGLTISGQSDASTYTSADLVVAFYNGNKLIAPIQKISLTNDVAGQNFVVDEDVDVTEIPEDATKVKAFLFDSLTKATPLMSNATLDLGE